MTLDKARLAELDDFLIELNAAAAGAILPLFRERHWRDGIEAGSQAIVAILIAHANEPRQRRS